MVFADAVLPTVTFARMTGPVSVSYQLCWYWEGKLFLTDEWIGVQYGIKSTVSFQNAVSSTWCWMACVKPVVPWVITRTWRRAAVVSATLPVAAVQGPWQTTVRPARHSALNSTRVPAPRSASLAHIMKLKLWNVKVCLCSIHNTKNDRYPQVLIQLHELFWGFSFSVLQPWWDFPFREAGYMYISQDCCIRLKRGDCGVNVDMISRYTATHSVLSQISNSTFRNMG